MDILQCWSLLYVPVTESKVPGPDLITVDEIAGVRLNSDVTTQRRKLNYNIPTKYSLNFHSPTPQTSQYTFFAGYFLVVGVPELIFFVEEVYAETIFF